MRTPLWLSMSLMCEGITEIPGPLSNPIIVRWAKEIHAPAYENDDIAWCAVYANRIMLAAQLPRSGVGYELLRASSFEQWGQPCEPTLGAVMVFDRPGGRHVGLYLGERSDAYYVHGGNTSNRVMATWIPKTRLRCVRWPSVVDLPVPLAPVLLTLNGLPLSTNEA